MAPLAILLALAVPPVAGPSLALAQPPPGDCNNDQRFDVGDAVYLLRYLFMGNAVSVTVAGCDVALDGRLDISDVVLLLSNLLIGRQPPAEYSVLLEWDPVSSDRGGNRERINVYRVYFLNGQARTLAAEVRNCACVNLSGLKGGVEYTLAVSAVDVAGNESSLSEPISFIR